MSSPRWWILGSIPGVSGMLVLVLCIISVTVRVNDMPRLSLPGETTAKLDGGVYFLYAEDDAYDHTDAVHCTVRDKSGPLPVTEASGPSYHALTRHGASVARLTVTAPGEVVVACTTTRGSRGAVSIGRNVGITMIVGVIAMLLGLAGTVVWWTRASRRRASNP